jgi:hypothetical protein
MLNDKSVTNHFNLNKLDEAEIVPALNKWKVKRFKRNSLTTKPYFDFLRFFSNWLENNRHDKLQLKKVTNINNSNNKTGEASNDQPNAGKAKVASADGHQSSNNDHLKPAINECY